MNKTAFQMPEPHLDDEGRPVISARELHAAIGSKARFSPWITDRIVELNLIEFHHFTPPLLVAKRKDFALTVDAAREIAFREEGETLVEICKYFILVEERKVGLIRPFDPTRHVLGYS